MPGGPTAPYTEAYGSRSAVGTAKETTFGTPVTPTNFFPMSGCTLDENPGLFYPQVMQGQRDLQIYPVYGQYSVSGTVDGPLFPSMGIPMLAYSIGTDAVAGSAPPYTHTITQANTLASMTIEKNVGQVESQQFFGCRVNKMAIVSQATNTEVTMSADIIGQGSQFLSSPTAVTTVNESPFVFAEATVGFFGSTGSTTISTVNSIEIDIENGLQSTYTLNGTHFLEFLTPVTLQVSGTIDIVFDNFDNATYGYYNKMLNSTTGSLWVTFTHPSNSYSIQLYVPSVNMATIAIAPTLTGVVMQTISWEAEYTSTSTTLNGLTVPACTIWAQVINQQSTAY